MARADLAPAQQKLQGRRVTVLSDVDNPLLGKNGATFVFGPQKGAPAARLAQLDADMASYAAVLETACRRTVAAQPGAGAAGGLGFALYCISDAQFVNGAGYIAGLLGLEERMRRCDMAICGEGRYDSQTESGKAPWLVAQLAKKYQKPLLVLAGAVGREPTGPHEAPVFCIQRGAVNIAQALADGEKNLRATARQLARLIALQKTP